MLERTEKLIVATRELRINEHGQVATVALYSPQPDAHGDWECSFEIAGLDAPIADSAFGIDAMQSLIQALDGIRLALEAAPASFSWAGENGDAGFPRFVPTFFGPEFSVHLGKLIDKEVAHYAAEAENRYKQSAKGR